MAICNLFKKLTNENGTFFSFSQYADDLTIHQSNNSYRVIPSKFICFDVDYTNFDNETLPLLLQNNFENGYAYLKNSQNIHYTPETTANLFWSSTQNLFNSNNTSNIVYIGDINIQSYSSKDNIGYNEIYCYIPNDAKKTIIENPYIHNEKSLEKRYNNDYILGYNNDDAINFNGLLSLDKVIVTGTNNSLRISNIKNYIYKINKILNLTDVKTTDDKSFSFNTIVILYDIQVDNNIVYKNIPLGMYVTGLINDGIMSNPVKKFVSNDEIYSAGTSYGLRVCNRLIVSPNGTSIKSDANSLTDEDRIYESLTQVMSAMVESQSKMDVIVDSIHNYQNNIKDHLAIIKNNRINVPYIKYVNSVPYWFVNGKNTGYTTTGVVGINYDKDKGSIAEGLNTEASGDYSHASGINTTSSGIASYAEGSNTEASGDYSHASGINTISSGIASYAGGLNTESSGDYSHTSGVGNIANNEAQFVAGKYATIDNTGNKIFQIGVGTDDNNRLDAFVINKDGTIEFEGDVDEDFIIDTDKPISPIIPLNQTPLSMRKSANISTEDSSDSTPESTSTKIRKKVVLNINDLDNLVNMNEIISTSVNDYYEGKQVPDFSEKLDEVIEVSNSNIEKLEELQQNIFDPDGNLTHDFINTMMSQVGADSMNFHMVRTKFGLDINGQSIPYNIILENDRLYIKEPDILSHFVYNNGPQNGKWNISGDFNTYLEPYKTYYLCLKCNRNDENGIWVCSERQYKTKEDPDYWYFNWGVLSYLDENYKLTETRGCSYMYGDNLMCGKISSIGGNSYFDLNNGDFVLGDTLGNPALKYIDGVLTIGGINDDNANSIMAKLGIIDDEIYLSNANINELYSENKRIEEEYKAAIAEEESARNKAVAELNIIQDSLQKQIDGEVSSYFYDNAPIDIDENILTDINPFNEWAENYNLLDGVYVLKDGKRNEFINHIGDTYTNIQVYEVGENGEVLTPFAGLSWRWCDATTINPLPDKYIIVSYKDINDNNITKYLHWHKIADSDAVKALQEASKAQSTADGKSTIFMNDEPMNYEKGDLWILPSNKVINGKEYNKGTILTANYKNIIFDENDWDENVKYTDDTVANQAQDYAERANENADNARINAEEAKAAAERAETGTQALNYLKTTMTDGTTDIAGGLVLTNVMALKDLDGNVTAGLSGLDEDNVLLWGGANYQDAVVAANHDYRKEDGELITSLIKKDGTGKIGVFEVDNDSAIVNDFTGDERVVISNKKINEQDPVSDISSKTYSTVDSTYQNKASIISNEYYIFNIPKENIENNNWNDDGVLSYMNGKISIADFALDSDSSSANLGFYIGIRKDTGVYDYISIQNIKLINNGNNKLIYDYEDPNVMSGTLVSLKFRIDLSDYNILGKYLDSRIKYAIKIDANGSNLNFSEGNDCNILFCCSTKKIQICSDGMRILTDNGCQTTFGNQFGYNKMIIKNLPGYTLNQNELTYDEYLQYQLYCSINRSTVRFFNSLNTNMGNLDALLLQFRDFFEYFNELISCLKEENLSTNTNTILTKLENCLKAGGIYTGNDNVERYGILSKRSSALNPSVDDYRLPLDDLTGESRGVYRKGLLNDLTKRSTSAAGEFDNVKTIHIK